MLYLILKVSRKLWQGGIRKQRKIWVRPIFKQR